MRPRWHFIVRAVLILAAVFIALFLALIVATFILFALQENGGLYAMEFGIRGYETFLGAFPWSMLLLFIALLLALGLFLRRHYAFAYQRSFFSLLLVLIAVIGLAGAIVPVVPFHADIYNFAANDGIPVIPAFYQYETTPTGRIYRGEVLSFGSTSPSFVLENAFGGTSTVFLVPTASSELQEIGVGEYVLIFGKPVSTDTIRAAGVEEFQNF